MDKEIKKKLVKNWFKILQDVICNEIENIENSPKKFISKSWSKNSLRDEGGGEYRILKDGKIFEKVGVNFSEVYGKFSKDMKKNIPGTKINPNFWASGISVVMHMKNPKIPAMHFNTRYIYTTFGWFGGGIDLSPSVRDKKEKNWFHNELKKTCNKHNKDY
ncbi:MAG: coproporphyrinogen III oxidase [Pelagibacterales bacterium]|nr:coproporphyrinogen III oxidase [Pelagibacterales bacterium]